MVDPTRVIPGAALLCKPGTQDHDVGRWVVLAPGFPLRSGRDDGGVIRKTAVTLPRTDPSP